MHTLPVIALLMDGDGQILAANRRWQEFSGYADDRISTLNFSDLITEDTHRFMCNHVYEGYFRSGFCRDIRLTFVRQDGVQRTGLVDARGYRGRDGRISESLVIIHDVTKEHAAQLSLGLSEQRFSGAFESAAHGMAIMSPEGRLLSVNSAFCDIMRMSPQQAQRAHLQDLVTEKWRPALLNNVGRILAGEIVSARLEIVFRAQPAKQVTGQTTLSVVRNGSGSVAHFVVQIIDLTSRRETEARLRHAQKMEAVGQLTGGVAHDFNNLLQVVMGNLQLIENNLGEGNARSHAEEAMRAAARGAELTRQLLAFSRRQSLDPEEVLVNGMISAMTGMIRRSVGEAIELKILPMAGDAKVRVDLAQLETALLNLVINGRDAMKGGGCLTIETCAAHLDEDYVAAYGDLAPGSYVMIAITDNGTGISEDVLDYVFEPFFTTKEEGQGSGLGLSMTYGFIKQSDGHIRIYSEPDVGTSVKMYLPRIDLPGVAVTSADKGTGDRPKAKTVLVVEDQEDVRKVAVGFVQSLGYEVMEAEDGIVALGMLRDNPDIDLLFTDIVMPGGMNGFDLSHAACELNPGLKVVHASGFPKGAVIHQQRGDIKDALIMKPYRKEELEAVLEQAIGSPAAA
ncbi:MAG: PAS domain S-box protein [Pseudomonadota bacterium]